VFACCSSWKVEKGERPDIRSKSTPQQEEEEEEEEEENDREEEKHVVFLPCQNPATCIRSSSTS